MIKERIMKALQSLSQREQRVILLYYSDDMSMGEIARVLEESVAQVVATHTRAMLKLRRKMRDW
jgi:RNA polymerase sigma factor for flagellar operon FliA